MTLQSQEDLMLKMFANTTIFLSSLFILSESGAVDNWSTPEVICEKAENMSGSHVAIDPKGNSLALFVSIDGDTMRLEWSTKQAIGDWSKPLPLSEETSLDYFASIIPQVSVDIDGNAAAIWTFPNGDKTDIHVAVLPFGSPQWIIAPNPLSSGIVRCAGPFLRMDKKGNALVAWGAKKDDKYFLESATLKKGTSDWVNLDPLEIPYQFGGMSMHLNSEGQAWMIWMKGGTFGENVIISSLDASAKSWSSPETLSEIENMEYYGPQIVSDTQGNVFASWQEYDQKDLLFVVYRRFKSEKDWKKTNFQNVKTHIYTRGWLSLDPKGNALFAWIPDDYVFVYSTLSQGSSTWKSPISISTEDVISFRGIMDSKGNRLLTWSNFKDKLLMYSTLPMDGKKWTDPNPITTLNATLLDGKFSANGTVILLLGDVFGKLQSVLGTDLFQAQLFKRR